MEDLEKYLFDPKNPKGFKSYKLLAEIIRRGKNIAFVDYYFLVEIFEKEIFSPEVINKLWDKPSNFKHLTSHQKLDVYVNNFSKIEFHEALLSRASAIEAHYFNKIFEVFMILNLTPNVFWRIENSIGSSHIKSLINIENISDEILIKTITSRVASLKDSLVLFIGKDFGKFTNEFSSKRSSIVITTLDAHRSIFQYPENFHPIILKQASDVHALLELVKREVNKPGSHLAPLSQFELVYPLQQIEIKHYFSLQQVKLTKLAKQKEIYLVGENGDGKTLLLQSILLGLKDNQVAGVVLDDYIRENPYQTKLSIHTIDAQKKGYSFTDGLEKHPHPYNHVFGYGINRFRHDSDKKEREGYLTLFSHEQYLENPVEWLQNIDYREKSGGTLKISLTIAKEILSELLDKNVTIEVSPDKVIFNERDTEVTFNQLSDGYKSVIIWISDLIARLSEKQPYVSTIHDFRGIVLVDEIGVYLHPKWQYTIVRKLRSWFPHIQFIFTTHSPIVIMGASKDATFYKVYKESGVTKVSDAVDAASIANLMANGIVTSPLLFGLADARSAAFDENKAELDTSDDYLSGKIHQAITQRIQDRNNVTEGEIMKLIQQELDKATTPQ